MKKYLKIVSLYILFVMLLSWIPAQVLSVSFTIISDPDPPPKGVVGKKYKVVFTTEEGYTMDRWEFDPPNPVPGLKLSDTINTKSVTMSGSPTEAGKYTFTVKVFYKGELAGRRQFTVTIRKSKFEIYMIQLWPVRFSGPATTPYPSPLPETIYEGMHVRFIFRTNHTDPHLITWTGLESLPGTRFKVLKADEVFPNATTPLPLWLKWLENHLPDAPILVMEGIVNASGTFRVSVMADDGSRQLVRTFIISVLPARCTLNMEVQPRILIFNATTLIYPPAPPWDSVFPRKWGGKIKVSLWLTCRGQVGENLSVDLQAQTVPDGFSVNNAVQSGHTWTLNNGRNLTLSTDGRRLNVTVTFWIDSPKTVSASYPGRNYTVRIVSHAENGNVKVEEVKLWVFHYDPELEIVEFNALSQTSNPSHNVWETHRIAKDLVTYGKQAAFYFTYKLNFTYPIGLVFNIVLPRSDWYWNVTSINTGGHCITVCPEDCMPTCEDVVTVWIDDQSYRIYERFTLRPTFGLEETRYILAEKFEKVKGLWFPKPITLPVHATLIVGEQSSGLVAHLQNPIRISKLFNSKNNKVGGLKLGYFIMDRDWFTQQQLDEIHDKFPSSIKVYLEGIFPVQVKEIRFLRYVSRPNMPGWRTLDTWAWDADTWGEWVSEANLDRAVMIVPDDGLDWSGSGTMGMVLHCGVCVGNDAEKVAVVEYHTITNYTFFPVIAHELSHTFGFPDIYYGEKFPKDYCTTCEYYGYARLAGSGDACTGVPLVFGRWAFFDEVHGGLITIGEPNGTDIMACGGLATSWAYHSWNNVAYETHDCDPPDGLLLSLIVFRNGTVIGKPFSRLYNHTRRYPPANGVGDAYIVLRNREGDVLRRYPVNLSYYFIAQGRIEVNVIPIVTVVEWFNDLGSIEFVGPDGKVWFRREVSLNSPQVKVIFPTEGLRLKIGRSYTLTWNGTDADGDELWYNVHFKKEGEISWMIIAHRVTENKVEFTVPDDLAPGEYILMVKATDGVNTGYDIVRVLIVDKLPVYRLTVETNIGLEINGSGEYEEGDIIRLQAPKEVRMEGLYGMLGGRYVFKGWTGDYETCENAFILVIRGEKPEIYIQAVYEPDMTIPYLVVGIVAVAVITTLVVLLLKKKSQKHSARKTEESK